MPDAIECDSRSTSAPRSERVRQPGGKRGGAERRSGTRGGSEDCRCHDSALTSGSIMVQAFGERAMLIRHLIRMLAEP